MYTLRRHTLCRRLLLALLQHCRTHGHGGLALNVSVLGDGLKNVAELMPLQLYRLVSGAIESR
jgi:hypothetical protein